MPAIVLFLLVTQDKYCVGLVNANFTFVEFIDRCFCMLPLPSNLLSSVAIRKWFIWDLYSASDLVGCHPFMHRPLGLGPPGRGRYCKLYSRG